MNILHTESSVNWGGQELRIVEECQWLNTHGHQAFIAARPDSQIFMRARDSGVSVLPVRYRGIANARAIKTIKAFCKEKKIDLINTHSTRDSWHAMWLRPTGIPVLRSLHVTNRQKDDWAHRFLWKRGNNGIIATAELIRGQLMNLGLDGKNIHVVGEYADPVVFNPEVSGERVRQELNVGDQQILITNIGMIRPDKGQTVILKAADKIADHFPNVIFLFVGEATRPDFREAFESELAGVRNRDNILISGYRNDIPAVMAASDYIVIASTEVEGQSKIAPQCYAMKKPLISSDAGALGELLQPGGKTLGILIPKNDPEHLASAVISCLSNGYPLDTGAAFDFFSDNLTIDSRMNSTLDIYTWYIS